MSSERKSEVPIEIITVGKNIKEIIAKKQMKVRIVAHDSDLDIESLRRYMTGKNIMGIDKIIKIAKALEVDISELFIGTSN